MRESGGVDSGGVDSAMTMRPHCLPFTTGGNWRHFLILTPGYESQGGVRVSMRVSGVGVHGVLHRERIGKRRGHVTAFSPLYLRDRASFPCTSSVLSAFRLFFAALDDVWTTIHWTRSFLLPWPLSP